MCLLLILLLVLLINRFCLSNSFIYEIRDSNNPKVCVYFQESLSTDLIDVHFQLNFDRTFCYWNQSFHARKSNEILVIKLSNQCSINQQLNTLKKHKFIGFILVDRSEIIFEDISVGNVGWIDSNEASNLKSHSNSEISRLKRDKYRFHPSMLILIGLVLVSMMIGNEFHRKIFVEKLTNRKQTAKTTKYQLGLIIGLLLSIFWVILYFAIQLIYLTSFLILSMLILYVCFSSIAELFCSKDELNLMKIRIISLCLSSILIIVWFNYYRLTLLGYIFTNVLVLCSIILLISQMRIINLTICLIVYLFLILFECLMLIKREDRQEKSSNILNGNIFDNTGYEFILSGGLLKLWKMNTIKWIINGNLPFLLSIPQLNTINHDCSFYTDRYYLSIDDVVLPSLLINFCRLFDIGNGITYRIYYIQALLAYILSLILSYFLMNSIEHDQLSSLIIYATLSLSTMIIGLIRKEFRMLLHGTLLVFEQKDTNSF